MRTYKILTLLIMVVGRLRQDLAGSVMGLVKDSPLTDDTISFEEFEGRGILIECCDCGLEHRLFRQKDLLQAWPLRPMGYDYRGRLGEREGG